MSTTPTPTPTPSPTPTPAPSPTVNIPPVNLAQLAAAVTAQTNAIGDFTDQQIELYTTTDPTVTMSDANGNPVVVPSWYATVGANAAAVTAMQDQVTANTAAIAAIDSGDTTINNSITALQTQQTTNTTNITNNTATIATILSNQTTDEANIATLQTQISTLQSGGTGNSTTIAAIQTQQQTDMNNITALQTQQATNVTNIGSLQTQQSTNTTNISGLQTQQSANTANISTNTTAISTINAAITAIQTQQSTDISDIANNNVAIGTNTSAISSLNTQLSSLNTTVGSIQSTQNTLETSVSTNNATLTTLQTSYSTVSGDVNTLQSTVGNLPVPGAYNPPFVSNRFFTQAFVDVDGLLLGGISRQSGKLWMNNGGWLSDRLDVLEYNVNTKAMGSLSLTTAVNAPTNPRYSLLFGTVYPSSTPGVSGYSNLYGGFNISTGDFEIGGLPVGASITQLTKNATPAEWNTNLPQIVLLGDSTLDGVALTGIPGKTTISLLAPSQTSTQLAARVGASPILVSVANRTVLASGSTTVSATQSYDGTGTLVTVAPITTDAQSQNIDGSIGGIPGSLAFDGTNLTFGSSVTLASNVFVGDNVPFIPNDAKYNLSGIVIIAVGRNNITDPAAIQRDIQNIVNAIPTREKRFIVVTPYPYAAEDNTTANGKAIIALEEWTAFNYPNNHVNTRQFLQNTYAALGGATPTTYFGNGLVPASYYQGDNQTLTTIAQGYLANAIACLFNQKGW